MGPGMKRGLSLFKEIFFGIVGISLLASVVTVIVMGAGGPKVHGPLVGLIHFILAVFFGFASWFALFFYVSIVPSIAVSAVAGVSATLASRRKRSSGQTVASFEKGTSAFGRRWKLEVGVFVFTAAAVGGTWFWHDYLNSHPMIDPEVTAARSWVMAAHDGTVDLQAVFSPENGAVIEVRIGARLFRIPERYFGSAGRLKTSGQMLTVFPMDMEPLREVERVEYRRGRGQGSALLSIGMGAQGSLDESLDYFMKTHEAKAKGYRFGLEYYETQRKPSLADIYVQRVAGHTVGFFVCTRGVPQWQRCDYQFEEGDLRIGLMFEEVLLPQWGRLETASRHLLEVMESGPSR